MLIRDNRTGSEDQVDKMRDTTTGIRVSGIRIGRAELRGVLIELTGEFDVHDLGTLRRTFDDTLSSGLPTYVDLSGVAIPGRGMHPGAGGSVPSLRPLRPPLGVTRPFLAG